MNAATTSPRSALDQLSPTTRAAIQKLILEILEAEQTRGHSTFGMEATFRQGQLVRLRHIEEKTMACEPAAPAVRGTVRNVRGASQ